MTDRLITLVDLLQPLCIRTYGTAPCAAALGVTGAAKCYNTRATCQDPDNYDGSGTLTIRLAKSQEGIEAYRPVITCLEQVNITPLTINLAGMDTSMSPFGRRESVSITVSDLLHSDLGVDPYRTERPTGAAGTEFDPYTSGSFWGKWLARNPYHEGMVLQVRQGLEGDTLEDMDLRHYVVDRITGPADGSATITAKDLFSIAEARKAKAPLPSRCELRIGVSEKHTGYFEIVPAEYATDYPGGEIYVAINDEVMKVERDENVLNIRERGALGTEAQDHDGGDKVQLVLHIASMKAEDIVYELLTEYTEIAPAYLPLAEWQAEMVDRAELLSAYIAEPTPVETLIGELAEQVGFSIWPSVTENLVKIKVLRPEVSITPTVDDNYWMLEGSFSSRPMVNQRVSEVWVYYGQRNPLGGQEDPANYRSRRIFADLESEGPDLYGTPAIREIFSRWIPQYAGTFAMTTGNRLLSIFRDPPHRAAFTLHRRRAEELGIAELFLLKAREFQNELGVITTKTMAPIELFRDEERIMVQAQEVRFFNEEPAEREILIEEDVQNFNMRDAYTLLYGTPVPGEVVVFRVLAGITIGSDDATIAAIDTGDWPPGVDVRLIIEAGARVYGRGGTGGSGSGTDGEAGSDGLFVRANMILDSAGTIAGGGGGGGGATEAYSFSGTTSAEGGGGAGISNGQGFVDGNDTEGGAGQQTFLQVIDTQGNATPLGPEAMLIATAGAGGNLGQPGVEGSVGGLGTAQTVGAGGAAGYAINGYGFVIVENEGTLVGEVASEVRTDFDPAPMAPDNLDLSAETALTTAGEYSTTLVFTFDEPDDFRIISYEAQVQTNRASGVWRPLYNSLLNRYEWPTSDLGLIRVRVRSVYIAGELYSAWVSTDYTNLGPFEALATIGMPDPTSLKFFITTDREKATAKIRIEATYDQYGEVLPDQLLLFYSVADNANKLDITTDGGTKLYINTATAIAGSFEMPVASGSSTTALKYTNPGGVFDIDLVGFWWAQPDDGVTNAPFLKVAEASETTMYFAPGEAMPFTPAPGDTINIIEANFSDSRSEEFRLVYMVDPNNLDAPGEVIRHNGIKRESEGVYYIDVAERGAEGTTQANQSGKQAHYFPAPGPLTTIVSIPASSFGAHAGVINCSIDVALQIPSQILWAAMSSCLARRTADGSRTRYVRSNIQPFINSGPA